MTLLELITRVSHHLLLWTHYYDFDAVDDWREMALRFASTVEKTTSGFHHTLHRYEYGDDLDRQGFCGGLGSWTTWMTKSDIMGALDHFGFRIRRGRFRRNRLPQRPLTLSGRSQTLTTARNSRAKCSGQIDRRSPLPKRQGCPRGLPGAGVPVPSKRRSRGHFADKDPNSRSSYH